MNEAEDDDEMDTWLRSCDYVMLIVRLKALVKLDKMASPQMPELWI